MLADVGIVKLGLTYNSLVERHVAVLQRGKVHGGAGGSR